METPVKVAVWGAAGVVGAALVTGIVTLLNTGNPPGGGGTPPSSSSSVPSTSDSPPTAPSSAPMAPAPPTATIDTADSVAHGGPLDLQGTASGLAGRELWLVVHPDEGEGYYLTSDGPVAVVDGPWTHRDPEVGDETDVGYNVTYLAYAANGQCATFLRETPDDGEGNVFRATMHESCGAPLASKVVAVT